MDPLSIVAAFLTFSSKLKDFTKDIDHEGLSQLAGFAEEAQICQDIWQDTIGILSKYPNSLTPITQRLTNACTEQVIDLQSVLEEMVYTMKKIEGRSGSARLLKSSALPLLRSKIEEASARVRSFKESVMMFRQVVIDSVTIYLLEQRVTPALFPNLRSKLVLDDDPQSGSQNIGVAEQCSMNVTIHDGSKDKSSNWIGAHAYIDTGCTSSWISRERLKRSDERHGTKFLFQLVPIQNHPPVKSMTDFFTPTHQITLTWYRGAKSGTRDTTFVIADQGPIDMLIGEDLIDEINQASGLALPAFNVYKLPKLSKSDKDTNLKHSQAKITAADARANRLREARIEKRRQEIQKLQELNVRETESLDVLSERSSTTSFAGSSAPSNSGAPILPVLSVEESHLMGPSGSQGGSVAGDIPAESETGHASASF